MTSKSLHSLNPEQRKAVTTTEGPLLVVAGPGTGKTMIIVRRIVHLLRTKPGLSPGELLVLTFSRRAAEEMQNRAEEAIPDHPDEFWILTFHTLCRRILVNHALDLGISGSFRLLDRVGQHVFLESVLKDVTLSYYHNMADKREPIKGFVRFINRCKDEMVTPKDYELFARSQETKEESRRHLELALVYGRYQEEMLRRGYLDFGDLILYTLALFAKSPRILKSYQEQFKYVLVDEFQDTNRAQIELIRYLSETHRNVCVVGDDDQAIYRFRGASYASFKKFKELFPDLASLKLTRNYRSAQNILEVSNRLIRHNEPDRFDSEKNIWSTKSVGEPVRMFIGRHEREEASWIANQIEALKKRKKIHDYSEVALLYRAHRHRQSLVKALEARGIPFTISGGSDLFNQRQVRTIVAALRSAYDPSDNISIFSLLLLEEFRPKDRTLYLMNQYSRRKELSLFEVLGEAVSWKLKPDEKRKIKNLVQCLHDWHQKITLHDVQSLITTLFSQIQELKSLKEQSKKRPRILQDKLAVASFLRLVDQFMNQSSKGAAEEFFSYLYYYDELGFTQEEGGFGEERVDKGVRMLTVHQAKGLEFNTVFLTSVNDRRFPSRRRSDPIVFPDELVKEPLPQGDFHLQEERRLFYVGLTRAARQVFLSGFEKSENHRSLFLKEALEDAGGTRKPRLSGGFVRQVFPPLDSGPFDDGSLLGLESVRSPSAHLKIDTRQFAKVTHLSYTQISDFKQCPAKYEFTYILRVPRRPHAALTFGSIVHETLEEFFNRASGKEAVDKKLLLDIFRSKHQNQGYPYQRQYKEYEAAGIESLQRFYETWKSEKKKVLYVEKKFSFEIKDKRIKGSIDRIDDLGKGEVEIIDYKTGKDKGDKMIEKNMQLYVYALACRERLRLNPRLVSLYFIQSNRKVSASVKEEELKGIEQDIAQTVLQIEKADFKPKVGYYCRWCDYQFLCPAYKNA